MARQDRMAQRCRLAASGGDCGRIRAQRLEALHRRQAADIDLGRHAECERKYRTEIVARDIVLLGARDNGEEGRAEAPGEESNTEPTASVVADSDIPF